MAEHNLLGKKGEELALQYLKENGYLIKEKNWRFGKDEIDIIAFLRIIWLLLKLKPEVLDFLENPNLRLQKPNNDS